MKIFKTEEYLKIENPTPGKIYRKEILTEAHKAKDLGGIFGLFGVGKQGRYHYHEKRESILFIISGEGAELVEGNENPVKAGDVIFIPPGEKHTIINKSDKDLRFLEFFTYPPVGADKVEID